MAEKHLLDHERAHTGPGGQVDHGPHGQVCVAPETPQETESLNAAANIGNSFARTDWDKFMKVTRRSDNVEDRRNDPVELAGSGPRAPLSDALKGQ